MPNRRIENITAKITGASTAETFDVYDDVAIHKYDTVASMVADTNLKVDEVCKTAGYNSKNDGGASLYVITSTADSSKYTIALSNGSYATMIREDVIVPEQFGAYGNGTNDDTGALRKCFAMSGNIHLPKGKTYTFSSYIPIISDSIIRMDASLTATAVAETSLDFFDRVTGAGGYTGVHNVRLYGEGVIDMKGDTMSDGYATTIRIHHCKNITVEGITIKNYSKFHAMEIGGSDGVIIDGMKFLGCFPNGDAGTHEAIQIETITEGGTNPAIPYDDTPAKNIIIRNCIFKDSDEGGLTYTSIGCHQNLVDSTWANYFSNITIESNTFVNNRNISIHLDSNFKNVHIINNVFSGTVNQYPPIQLDYYMDNITISNNVFENLSYEILILGKDIPPATDSNNVLKKVSFCNNFINGYNGLGISYCTGVTIKAITEDLSILNNVFKYTDSSTARPIFLSGYFRGSQYCENMNVQGNVFNGYYLSNPNTFEHTTSADTLFNFLASRISKLFDRKDVEPVSGFEERNMYFIYGSRTGYYDVFSIAYYNKYSSRVTMVSFPQPTNLAKVIVSQYANGNYTMYQIALSSFSE